MVHHRGCPLACLHRGCCNPGCPGRLSHTCTRKRRGKHRDHTREAAVSQRWSTGSSSTYSPTLSATCIYLLRGQKVANYHGKGNSSLSRMDCDLVLLSCLWYRRLCSGSKGNMRLDMGVFAWGHMMHEQDACGSFGAKLQCWKGRIGKIHIGVSRGPQTLWPSGQRWQPEITPLGVPQTSVQGRVVSTAGLSKPALYTVSVLRVFSLPQGNQRSLPDSSPGLSGLYLAWIHQPPRGWTYPMLVGNRHGCIRWGNGMQHTLCPW